MKKRPVIIDCDPGVDDALAIMLASKKEELDILAITSVSGNVGIDQTTNNARLLAKLCNIDCPVARGAEKPLVVDCITASKTHGKDGFGGLADFFDENDKQDLSDKHAVNLIAEIIKNSDEKVTIIAIGPLTNIATLFTIYPEVKNNIEVISIMGGSTSVGNVTAKSEFNFYVDPEAANIVLNSGVPIILSGLNVTLSAYIKDEEIDKIENLGTNLAIVAAKIVREYKKQDPALHDPVAVLALTNPEIMEFEDMYLNVEYGDLHNRGMSYVDERTKSPKANCKVVTEINREEFINHLNNILANGD